MNFHKDEVAYISGCRIARVGLQYSNWLDECLQSVLLNHEIVALLES